MANPITQKQVIALETIATHTTNVGKTISINMNSLMGSIESTNIISTRAVLASLQAKGFIRLLSELKEENVEVDLTSEGAEYIKSMDSFATTSENIDRVIAGKAVELPEPDTHVVIEAPKNRTSESQQVQVLIKAPAVEPIKEIKIKVPKEKKAPKEKVENKDEDGNFCPKKGDEEGGSKSWNIYQFLRQKDEQDNPPSNNLITSRMADLGRFHTVYYSEIQRIRDNYNVTLKD